VIEQQARVMAVEDGITRVIVGGVAGCPACDAGQGCGAGIFGRLLQRKPIELRLPDGGGATVGQAVTLGIPESLFLRLAFRLYGLPLLAGLAGGLICHQISGQFEADPLLADMATLAGMAAAMALAITWRGRRKYSASAAAVRILPGAQAGQCNLAEK
jgi:sigma-E factor negative regulatory protein RseC